MRISREFFLKNLLRGIQHQQLYEAPHVKSPPPNNKRAYRILLTVSIACLVFEFLNNSFTIILNNEPWMGLKIGLSCVNLCREIDCWIRGITGQQYPCEQSRQRNMLTVFRKKINKNKINEFDPFIIWCSILGCMSFSGPVQVTAFWWDFSGRLGLGSEHAQAHTYLQMFPEP